MTATLSRNLGPNGMAERCERCNGQLAYQSGPRGVRDVVCGSCGYPAGAEHPLQKELDQAWREREAEEAAAQKRQAQAVPTKPAIAYQESHLYEELERLKIALALAEQARQAEALSLREELSLLRKEVASFKERKKG